jgi:hypothetical protein
MISFESGSTGIFGAGGFVCEKQTPVIRKKNKTWNIRFIWLFLGKYGHNIMINYEIFLPLLQEIINR